MLVKNQCLLHPFSNMRQKYRERMNNELQILSYYLHIFITNDFMQ